MTKKRFAILLAFTCLVFMLLVSFSLASCGKAQPAGPTELEAITFWDTGSNEFAIFETFANTVNQRSNGRVVVKRVGGMEVAPLFEMGNAAKEGVVDMVMVFPPALGGLIPGADLHYFSEITREEEHKRGLLDAQNEMWEKAGLRLVGEVKSGLPEGLFYIFLNKKVAKPQELAGVKLAAEMTADPFMKALGIVPVTITDPEIYTAMERGVIDGFHNPLARSVDLGLVEVSKYVINHPFYHGRIGLSMNLDAWNQLPGDMQDVLTEAMLESERVWYSMLPGLHNVWWQEMLDAGVEPIQFSPADAEYYLSRMYGAAWDHAFAEYPDVAAKIADIVRK